MREFAGVEAEDGLETELSLTSPQLLSPSGSMRVFGRSGISDGGKPLDDFSLDLSLGCASASKITYSAVDKLDLALSLSTGATKSVITSSVSLMSPQHWRSQDMGGVPGNVAVQLVDEGSTSKRNVKRLGLPLGVSLARSPFPVGLQSSSEGTYSLGGALSMLPAMLCSGDHQTAGLETVPNPEKLIKSRICQVSGCRKGARGASGRCISHGGGRRCERDGCQKGAEGRTVFCKGHGGGRRCERLGCTKTAEGRTDFCITHGGGRRCSHEGCTRASRGKSGLCIRHGGGKRCKRENCTKSAEGSSGLCIAHGGGRRCQMPGCTKGAQGSTMFCKGHGGGRRCTALGCTKGAEGSTPFCKGHGGGRRCSYGGGGVCPKSVHGGTLFCVRHGGGKRCAAPGCTKSARGKTSHCVRHGGGKRCQHEGCTKSAQGSTDFCKAHGGGKRCAWVQFSSEPGNLASNPCDKFVSDKSGLCAFHGTLSKDKRVHGGDLLGPSMPSANPNPPKKITESISPQLNRISPQKTANDLTLNLPDGLHPKTFVAVNVSDISQCSVPEGRVHGGNLMELLDGNLGSC
uniref:WRKY19-like zinc finger domain-containing protein n=1 Tax=Kalanchoe fedtschenkoi TaxID=63787 RepID=A0A7N0ZYR8_KALFE